MSHEYEDEIKCPYCDYEFSDSWEYNDDDGTNIECPECDKSFTLDIYIDVSYSTHRLDCEDGNHDYKDAYYNDIDQETCDRWNRTDFCGRSDHKPYRLWIRSCKNCDESQYKEVEPGGECPWIVTNEPAT